ncbi:MAG: hypothetical protein KAI53_02720 [Candidatus Aenigmarchaeota archaeon]|nr:hypothetical protein [Candidatus Aenigmarchaeota archaeon]
MDYDILKPENLRTFAKKINATGQLDKVHAVFGFGIEGELLASSIGFLFKKPNLSKEIILRNKIMIFPEEIRLLVIANAIDEPEILFETIKQFRKKGIKIEKIVTTSTVVPEIEDELRVLGVGLISV